MKLFFYFLLTLMILSCSSFKNYTNDVGVLISYESGLCYGKCAVFKIKINNDRNIEYEGFKNVENIGKYKVKISINDFNDIENLVSTIDLKKIDSIYTSNSTDLHLRILTLNRKNQSKKILLFDNIPFELKQIENKVYSIIEKYKYKFFKN